MTHIDRQAYWLNTILGFVLGFTALLCAHYGGKELLLETPEHQNWREYHAWHKENKTATLQHHFERLIADPNYPSAWVWDESLREAAALLRDAAQSPNYKGNIHDLERTPHFDELIRPWKHCGKYCSYDKTVKIIQESERLKKIVHGNKRAISPLPPEEVPQKYRIVSALTKEPVEYDPYPLWWNIALWGIFSGTVALIYFGLGFYFYTKEPHWAGGNAHPFKASPDFLLGWLLYLAWAPGYCAAYLLAFLFSALTADITSSARHILTQARRLNKHNDLQKDEYTSFYQALITLKGRAEKLDDQKLGAEIQNTLDYIDSARKAKSADQAEEIRSRLRSLQIALRAHSEADSAGR